MAPLVFEAGGRSSDEAAALVRSYVHGLSKAEHAMPAGGLEQRLGRVLQLGIPEMVLRAVHG